MYRILEHCEEESHSAQRCVDGKDNIQCPAERVTPLQNLPSSSQ